MHAIHVVEHALRSIFSTDTHNGWVHAGCTSDIPELPHGCVSLKTLKGPEGFLTVAHKQSPVVRARGYRADELSNTHSTTATITATRKGL
jgi:hypothetical protein